MGAWAAFYREPSLIGFGSAKGAGPRMWLPLEARVCPVSNPLFEPLEGGRLKT